MTEYQGAISTAVSHRIKRKRFKTIDGHCYVLDDKIIITRDRNMTLEQAFESARVRYLKIGIFLLCTIFALAYSFLKFSSGDFYPAAVYLSICIGSGLISKSEISKAMVEVIEKELILNAQYYGSKFGRRNSGFQIAYSKDYQVRIAEILLPKPKNSGKPNTQKALELMEGIINP